jgi:DNA-binding response OmpR family regulator
VDSTAASAGKQTASSGVDSGNVSHKTKILIVEDDTPLAMPMLHVLSDVSCRVQVARCGEKAMELAGENRFVLIALNMDSPLMNCIELCKELPQRHTSCRTSVVLLSERPNITDDNARADCITTKPFEVGDFVCRIVSHAEVKLHRTKALEPDCGSPWHKGFKSQPI